MNIVGRSEVRVDAFDKATGRTKYYDDLAPKDALIVRVKHSTIAHGFVKSVDISKAEKIPGVVKILTCFDVPDIPFPTAGHPWSMDPSHQDIADRHLLNQHVRYYGDDVCAVIAEDEVAAMQAGTVRRIVDAWQEHPNCITAAAHNGKRGNPCLFPSRLFPELCALEADRGGSSVIRRHEDALLLVEAGERELFDCDTKQALEILKGNA